MILKIHDYKNQILFAGSVTLFAVSLFFLAYVYVVIQNQNDSLKDPIEVSLPVIDWQRYSSLSKQYPNDIIE